MLQLAWGLGLLVLVSLSGAGFAYMCVHKLTGGVGLLYGGTSTNSGQDPVSVGGVKKKKVHMAGGNTV